MTYTFQRRFRAILIITSIIFGFLLVSAPVYGVEHDFVGPPAPTEEEEVGPPAPTEEPAPTPAPKEGESAAPAGEQLINPLGGTDQKPGGVTNIPVLVGKIIAIMMSFLGSLGLLFFIYGGFLWMTSRGKQDQVQKGTRTMAWAVIGIVFVFSSYAIILFILNAIGAK